MIYYKYISGWLLLLVAIVAFKILWIPLTAWVVVNLIVRLRIKGIFEYLNNIARGIAVCIDILANVLFGRAFNDSLNRGEEYKFGQVETISKALGKNKERGTLTKLGRFVADGLNKIDPNHVEKAAS